MRKYLETYKGVLLALSAVFLNAFHIVYVRLIHIGLLSILLFRSFTAFLSFFILMFLINIYRNRNNQKAAVSLPLKNQFILISIGTLYSLRWLFMILAVQYGSVEGLAIGVSLSVIFSLIVEPLLMEGKISIRIVEFICAMMIVLAIVMLQYKAGIYHSIFLNVRFIIGMLFSSLGCFAYVCNNTLTKKYITKEAIKTDSFNILKYEYFGATIVIFITFVIYKVALSSGYLHVDQHYFDYKDLVNAKSIFIITLATIICSVVPNYLLIEATKTITVTSTNFLFQLQPIVLLFLSYTFFMDGAVHINPISIFGVIILLVSCFGHFLIKGEKTIVLYDSNRSEPLPVLRNKIPVYNYIPSITYFNGNQILVNYTLVLLAIGFFGVVYHLDFSHIYFHISFITVLNLIDISTVSYIVLSLLIFTLHVLVHNRIYPLLLTIHDNMKRIILNNLYSFSFYKRSRCLIAVKNNNARYRF
ncbi:MAG: hypothetical protein QM528_08040 [Phycisphaerales bacterium]|nr:hypothetical protein [Phycisphaerales bacterium]